jgi:hypothetical protein
MSNSFRRLATSRSSNEVATSPSQPALANTWGRVTGHWGVKDTSKTSKIRKQTADNCNPPSRHRRTSARPRGMPAHSLPRSPRPACASMRVVSQSSRTERSSVAEDLTSLTAMAEPPAALISPAMRLMSGTVRAVRTSLTPRGARKRATACREVSECCNG